MGVGPHDRSLFDRIAAEMTADAPEPGDVTAELERLDGSGRPSRPGRRDVPSGHESRDDVVDGTGGWPAPDVSTQMARPIVAERQCSRSGCSDTAAVTLTYHYGQSQVWIDRLSPEREPHAYDMCERHAARLSVPLGWHLDDRRRARRGALIAV